MAAETRRINVFINNELKGASPKALAAEYKKLKNEVNKLTPGTDAYIRKTRELQKVKGRLSEVNKEIHETRSRFERIKQQIGPLGGGIAAAFAVQQISQFASQLFGVLTRFRKINGEVQRLTGLTGDMRDKVSSRVKAIANTFNRDFREVLKAANTASEQFGISTVDALDKIEKGLLAGGSASNDFLTNIQEYSSQFSDAQASADQFIATTVEALNKGVFSDKGADAIKEFGLRVREQSKAAKDALDNAFSSNFRQEIFQGIQDGSVTTVEALERVSGKLDELNPQQRQSVISNLFGGPGEDAGQQFISTLSQIDGNISKMIDSSNKLTQAQERQLQKEKELASAQEELNSAMGDTLSDAEALWTGIQTNLLQALTSTIQFFKQNAAVIKNTAHTLGILAGAVATYKTTQLAANLVVKRGAMLFKGYRIAITLYKKAVQRAAVAQSAFNKASKANVIGAIVTAVTTAVALWQQYKGEVKEVSEQQRRVNEATQELNRRFGEQAAKARSLFNQLKFTNKGTERYDNLIKQINNKYGEYLNNQLTEKSNLEQIERARRQVLKGLRQEIALKVAQEKTQEILSESLEKESKFVQQVADKTELNAASVRTLLEEQKEYKRILQENLDAGDDWFKAQEKAAQATDVNKQASAELSNTYIELEGKQVNASQALDNLIESRQKDNKQIKAVRQSLLGQNASLAKNAESTNALTQAQRNLIKTYAQAKDIAPKFTKEMLQQAQSWKQAKDEAASFNAELEKANRLKGQVKLDKQEQTPGQADTLDQPDQAAQDAVEGVENQRQKEREARRKEVRKTIGTVSEQGRQLGQVFNMFHRNRMQQIKQEKQAELDKLERQKEKGILTESQYQRKRKQLAEDFDKKQAKLKAKQARREKAQAIFQTVVDTAAAVVKALPNLVLAGVVGALGAAKTAAIASQPVPQFAAGGRTVRGRQDGKQYQAKEVGSFASGGRAESPSVGLVGEKGPELVVPNWLYESPQMADTMSMIESQIGAKQFAEGGPTSGSKAESTVRDTTGTSRELAEMRKTQQEQTRVLNDLNKTLKEGVPGKIQWREEDSLNTRDEIQRVNEIDQEADV
jgi:hypothetical protein